MADLSPEAQAVLDATDYPEDWATRVRVAAALRAAVNEVASLSYEDVWTDDRWLQYEKDDPVRNKLLAIAAELEGLQ